MKRFFIQVMLFFIFGSGFAQQVSFVKDINSSANNYGSGPYQTVALGSSVVFVASTPTEGSELWISNGTSGGTTILKDINPGGFSSNVSGLTNIGGTIYFSADDGVNGQELWKTDGTSVGTVLVKDINPGPGPSGPSEFTLMNGTIYFRASTDNEGSELWKTNGTSGGTSLVSDINAGNGGSYPGGFKALGTSYLIFQAYSPTTGYELYKYNGTVVQMTDLVAGTSGSSPSQFTYNASLGLVFFVAYTPTTGYEIWKTNGDFAAGTTVYDFVAGSGSSYPYYLTSQGSYVYFQAYTATTGYELYKANGSGVSLVSELIAGSGSSSPNSLVATGGGGLFFSAYDGTNYAIRYTTGTSISTITNTTGMSLYQMIGNPSSDNVYFSAYTSANGYELWKATNTTATMIKDIVSGTGSSYPYYLVFNGSIFFSADDGTKGSELWYSDGTTVNTNIIKDINSATDSNIQSIIATAAGFLISANDGVNGQELWKTDVTSAGTALVKDVLTGSDGSGPNFLGKVGTNYFFSAYTTANGTELWKTDGTAINTSLVMDIESGVNGSYPDRGVVMGTNLYFRAYNSTYGYEVWKTDGTTTTLLKDIYSGNFGSYPDWLTVVGSTLYFTADDGTNGNELWKSDGTTANTTLVKNINLAGSSYANSLVNVNGTLFFNADDGANGYEIWKSDGTSPGTSSPKDIYSGSGSSYPQSITALGSIALFTANDGTNGVELWKSDGTLAGTSLVKDIYTGASNSSYPQYLTVAGSKLYFSAYEPSTGYELYVSDGTAANTTLVTDIRSGSTSSSPNSFANVNGTLYFNAADATGNLLFKSNGASAFKATSAGTTYDNPGFINYYNSKVFFVANTTQGREPLTVMAEPSNQPTSLNFTGRTASSISGSFTAAAGVSGYIVIRKSGSASTDLPIDGAPYSVGATIGSSTVAAIGAGTTFTDSGLSGATTYYYSIYSYSNDGTANVYRPWSPLQGNSSTLATEPTNQATGFTVSSATVNSFTVSYTAAAGAPAGYIALRNAGISDLPTDGTAYSVGNTIGVGTVVYVGSALTFPQSSLTAGTSYNYSIFAYNGSGTSINYYTVTPLTGTASTLVAEPTAQPTSLSFSNITVNSQAGSFAAASPAAAGYITIRNTSASINPPVDGVVYSVGSTIGSSTVVNISSSTGFTSTGLTAGTIYYYGVYSYNGSGGMINYFTTSPLSGNTTTLALEPTAQPTGFSYSSVTASSYTVTFVNASPTPAGYIILRVPGATPPTDIPVDGVSYTVGNTIGSSTVVQISNATTLNETGLPQGATYSYAIFSGAGAANSTNYLTTAPLIGTASTLATTPSAQPTALAFSAIQATSASVSWTAAAGSPTGYLVLRKVGSAPTGVPSNGVDYTGQTIGDGTVVYTGTSTSFNDTGLTPTTNYYYSVFSYNGSGASSNYLTLSPLTGNTTTLAPEPTAQPTAMQFSNVNLTALTVSFTAATPAPNGYLVIRNAGSAPTAVPVDGTTYTAGSAVGGGTGTVVSVGINNTIPQSGLTSATTYHYAAYSYNNTGGPINYLTVNPLIGNRATLTPDGTPPDVTNTTSASISSAQGSTVKIKATVVDPESGVTTVQAQYRSISGNPNYTTIDLTSVGSNNWESADITLAQVGEIGIDFKIIATNGQMGVKTSSNFKVLVTYGDQSIPYNAAGSEQLNYRIISIPLNLTDKTINAIFNELGPYNNTKWRMFKYENGAHTELSGSSTIELGKGYWFITKEAANLTTGTGNAANVTADQPFTYNLVAGWNLIGNPYLFNVLWSDVLSASGNISLNLRTYAGSFSSGSVLKKFEGAFVMASQATVLTFPTAKNPAAGRIRQNNDELLKNSLDMQEWEVLFNVTNGELSNALSGIGMRPNAKSDYDKFDDFTLPRLIDYLEVNHQKSFLKIPYSKDVVPTEENHIWDFSIDSNLKDVATIAWDNSFFGNNKREIVLVDVETQAVIDMRARSSYSFEHRGKHNLKVIFGNSDFVRENSLPDGLIINNIYPNPSASKVTFGFTTPNYEGEIKVDVKLHNTLGQSVSNLFSGALNSGYHEVTWDGNDTSGVRVGQGIYLVEVKIGKQVRTGKVIVK